MTPTDPRVLPYGDRALLVELGDIGQVVALADRVRADPVLAPLVDDVVPAARTVLVVATASVPVEEVAAGLAGVLAVVRSGDERRRQRPGRTVTIPVTYDGPDLVEVARLTGLSEEGVVAAHTGGEWRVGFGGFAPGFAYLVGGDPQLRVPRRDSPRTSVPAGAVGLAGEFSGVYPRSSPGGWQLIGRTNAVMWDVDRDPPALLAPGAAVRFARA